MDGLIHRRALVSSHGVHEWDLVSYSRIEVLVVVAWRVVSIGVVGVVEVAYTMNIRHFS